MTDHSQPAHSLPSWFTAESVDTVIVAFPDVYGRLMGKRLAYDHFVSTVKESGTHGCNYLLTVDMDMNPLEGFELASWQRGYGDFHLSPDLATLRRVPWRPGSAIVLCDLAHEDHRPVAESPRAVLKRQVAALEARGWSAAMGSELEFYLFHDTYRGATAKDFRNLVPSSDYLIDYHLTQTDADEDVLGRIRKEMSAAGIVVEGSKGEWGKGQHEINLLYADALEMADRHALYKYGAKQIAAQQQRSITFMAKPASDAAGNSFHLHASLWDQDGQQNLFSRADNKVPTDLFHRFLAGLIAYGRELTYFFAPTVNSYKRYQFASWAPTSLVWAHDNRTTGFRVIGSGVSLRIENRCPGADANPYLAMAATIAAGLHGIDEKLDCGEPYVGNAYVDAKLPRLPTSLDVAGDLLERSEMAREALGDEVIDFYVHTARLEGKAYREAVTDWERRRYFERV